eukprot:UN29177
MSSVTPVVLKNNTNNIKNNASMYIKEPNNNQYGGAEEVNSKIKINNNYSNVRTSNIKNNNHKNSNISHNSNINNNQSNKSRTSYNIDPSTKFKVSQLFSKFDLGSDGFLDFREIVAFVTATDPTRIVNYNMYVNFVPNSSVILVKVLI